MFFSWGRSFRRGWRSLFLGFLCFVLVVACNTTPKTSGGDSPSPATNGRIVVGMTAKPRTIDPADSYEIAGINIIYNVTETLYTYKPQTTELVPQLATELPKVSADGLTYRIPVRSGVTFHDGTPFDAEAMAFSLNRFMKNGGKPSFLLADAVAEVKAQDASTLVITLKKPFAAFPALLAFPGTCAISPKAYEIGENKFNPSTLVGTGPYLLKEFTGDRLKLDLFPNYWGSKPSNQGIDMQIYGDNSANLFNSFRTGAVAVAYESLDPDQIQALVKEADQGKIQAIATSGSSISYLGLNVKTDPVKTLPVRQAIAHFIDRQLIIDRVFQGQAEPLYSMVPSVLKESVPLFKDRYGDAQFDKAKEILTQAGFTPEKPATVEVWYPSGSTTRGLVASLLKALAEEKMGGLLQLVPSNVEGATFFSSVGKGLYATTLSNWYPDFLDADNYVQPFLQCTQGSPQGCESGGAQTQGSFYWSEKMNRLIDEERKEQEPAQRLEAFKAIQTLMAEDLPYIPLWQTKDYLFAQGNLKGVMRNPNQTMPFWMIRAS